MLSEKANKNVLECRFCWMCRHLCPVGLATGKESNTPRAKGLLLDMAERGSPFSASLAAELYECCLCGACAGACETGFDPRLYIREGRTEALVRDLVPPPVQSVLDSLSRYGNIFGAPAGKNPAAVYGSAEAEVLFYAGATALVKAPEMVIAAAKLFKKAGIPFQTFEEEPPCGAELADCIGHVDETLQSTELLRNKIQEAGVKKVVVLDTSHAKVMRLDYPAWNAELSAEVITATAWFDGLVQEGKLKPAKVNLPSATYHDPSHLARDLDETESARHLLAAMGIEIREMFLSRKLTRSSGGAVLASYAPQITRLMAAERWKDVDRCGADTLIASCPASYYLLKAHKAQGKEVKDLYSLLAEACGV
jgi:Fe-S oxidoreductase